MPRIDRHPSEGITTTALRGNESIPMTMDLSRANQRTANQARDRLTERRDGILPARRDTRADEYRAFASMSSARRGDGGAEQLMRTLGIVQDTAQDFQSYAAVKHKKDEEENAAQGALDQAADRVNEERAKRSYGYRNAVARGRTMEAWNAGLREFGDELRGVVEGQDQLTLEERQADVRERVETFFETFAVDPETGQLRSFLATPDSMKYLAEQMGLSRPQFEAVALDRIEERFNEEAKTLYGTNIRDQILAGRPIDLELAGAVLPPTVTDEERRKTILATAVAVADELKASGRAAEGRRVFRQLLGNEIDPADTGLAVLQQGPQPADVPPSETAGAPAAAPPRPDRVPFDKLAAAVMHRESRGNPDAVSPKGARGTMQTMPGTLTDPGYGVRPAQNDTPAELERVGKDYLRAMLREYKGNYAHALAAYNAGPGNADKWVAEFGALPTDQFIARIPFKETREYVEAVLASVGVAGDPGGAAVTPDDPVVADPYFALPDEALDPIELADRDFARAGLPQLLTGGLALTPAERVSLTEAAGQYAREVQAEWMKEKREAEDREAHGMMFRLYGQGGRITSQDITDAARNGTIRPEQGFALLDQLRQNAAMAERYEDRQEAEADRARAKAREDQAESLIAHYTGGLYSGRETPAQARNRVLRDVGKIRDPAVRSAVMAAVGEETNRIESLRSDSAPFRNTMKQIDDDEAALTSGLVAGRGYNPGDVATLLRNKADIARKRIAERILNGEDADAAYNAEMRKVVAEKVRLTAPRKPAGSAKAAPVMQ